MIIRVVAANSSVDLEDTRNFRAFAVRVEGAFETEAAQDELLGRVAVSHDGEHAWIAERVLRSWPSLARESWWQDGLTGMIAAARRFGWIDDSNQAIRAHIEHAP